METVFYTYMHCKPNGDPFYVGKGSLERCKRKERKNKHYTNIVSKYGKENIQILMSKKDSEKSAFKSEIRLIKILRDAGFVLSNRTDGGEGSSGYVPSEITRAKLSKMFKGRKLSDEWCANISSGQKGVKKQPTSIATKEKLSLILKGKKKPPRSQEHKDMIRKASAEYWSDKNNREKMSITITGKIHTEETKEKISKSNMGRVVSDETRKKISDAHKGKIFSPETIAKMSFAAKHRKK